MVVSNTKVVAAFIFAFVFLGLMFFFSVGKGDVAKDAQVIADGVKSFEELSENFRDLADKRGAVYAFDVLRVANLPPQTDLHLLGHVVGEKLYEQEGVEGIEYCTPDFRNACSHTIVIGALADFGEGALSLIRDACSQAPGGVGAYTMCFHGLGHGVTAGYQYKLEPTIDFCKQTATTEYNDREYVECFGGAIMELMGGGGHDPHLWERAREEYLVSPLSPCMDAVVPEELKSICLVYLTPKIWEDAGISLAQPEPEKFKAAFDVCEEIPESQVHLRRSCFGGFGKEFVPLVGARDIRSINDFSGAQFRMAIDWCMEARSNDGKQYCVQEALNSVFWGGENDIQQSFVFCEEVQDTTIAGACYDSIGRNIRSYVTDRQAQVNFCSLIPPEYVPESCQSL